MGRVHHPGRLSLDSVRKQHQVTQPSTASSTKTLDPHHSVAAVFGDVEPVAAHRHTGGVIEAGDEAIEAADEKQLNKTIARYGRVDLLCIDELGYMELDRHGAELLFQVPTEREEKNSVAIASNESFGGWTKTFTDPRLCAAIVDRLTFNGTIIETGTDSYRLASTRARAEEPAKAG